MTPQTQNIVRLEPKKPHGACADCRVRELCLPAGLNFAEIRTVDNYIHRKRTVVRGDALFHHTTPFQMLYAVHTGFMKTSVRHPDGGEQVTGFHMPGDLLGLDALDNGAYISSAVALEASEVCEISLNALELLTRKLAPLQRHFHRMMSREIVHRHEMMLLLANVRAQERVADFLFNLSERHAARGQPATDFVLHMTRTDIGSYLGLTIETVCRGLAQLRKENLIEMNGRRVHITDLARLKSIAERGPVAPVVAQ